jgi:ribonuclease HII
VRDLRLEFTINGGILSKTCIHVNVITNPTFKKERELLAQGYCGIVGIDEAGCGALAGPLVAGAVIFPLHSRLSLVRDSKLLSESQREGLFEKICEVSDTWAVGSVSPEEIFKLGLRQANYLAMKRALNKIQEADFVLVDAWTLPGITIPQQGIIRGDKHIKSIAAASIIAKVTRDRVMRKYGEQFPEYGFEIHKGYATKKHRNAIAEHGPCPIHRMNYKIFQPRLFS